MTPLNNMQYLSCLQSVFSQKLKAAVMGDKVQIFVTFLPEKRDTEI